MKQLGFLISMVAAAALAACGGGGGVSGTPPTPGGGYSVSSPTPTPTATPTVAPVSYKVSLAFTGTLAGNQTIQDDLRRLPQSGPATPLPIMIQAVTATDSNGGGGTLYVQVSPFPSASPTVAYSTTTTDVSLATPVPTASPEPLPSGVVSYVNVGLANLSVTSQSGQSASATVTIPSPAPSTTPTVITVSSPILIYPTISMNCSGNSNGSPIVPQAGYSWNGSAWVTASSPSTADIYLASQYCGASFSAFKSASGTDNYLHFPYGATVVNTDTAYCNLVASTWTNVFTEYDLSFTNPANFTPDGAQNAEFIFKTASGAIAKYFSTTTSSQLSNNALSSGPIQVSGSSIDGF